MTQLPEPMYANVGNEHLYTAEQMTQHEAAGFKRGIDAALAVLVARGLGNGSVHLQVKQLGEVK